MRWTPSARQTSAREADGEAVWSWRPDAGVKSRGAIHAAMVARKPGHQGERGVSRKPPRRESRMPPLDLYARVRFFVHVCTRAYRFSGGSPAFPAQWFYGLYRVLPGDRAFLPPSPALLGANLTPASGRQDHTTSPSASGALVFSTISVHRSPFQRS